MSHHVLTPVDELRHWTRFAKERGSDFAVIWRPGSEEILAEVHDESLAGLGLYLDNVTDLDVGQEVEVVYSGEFMRGYIRHVEPLGREYVVGVDCDRGLSPESE